MEAQTHTRVALVTGGARGIGRACVDALVEDGHAVVIADLLADEATQAAQEISDAGGTALGVAMNVADSASVDAGVAAALERFGAVDALVNCAGWDDLMPFVKTDEALWDKVIEINYKGVLRTTHALLPGMIERGYGRIVNIGSDAGRVGSSMEAVYAGAKGGVIAFSKTVAREAARKGVTANVVCPGPTDTPMLRGVVDASPDGDKVIAAMTSGVAMKRLGQPAEVAAAVAFFASEKASFITGQTLSVSGGLTMA
ncbi:SDR family oxidoreductase [Conexibacter sp. W3-3-2]|uniref:2-hydroxycyclohexanecarboxyl-CoA dehydrogenase n=1 Tax=Paraconexibacter algicola TaxID=2133960 RepID=A0A2T4UJX6_9ACTN|nr:MULTISPECIES: SDR family oxidoreductase [Solirubrobacterales]MTD45878.1 SDR family oxidoreductase [Conexibacter sp. W3-3-2]PTL59531.1 2-hydroxycyclohexanecarboxyl-CoA dehydrogenase [Paraconexibacter algicola]